MVVHLWIFLLIIISIDGNVAELQCNSSTTSFQNYIFERDRLNSSKLYPDLSTCIKIKDEEITTKSSPKLSHILRKQLSNYFHLPTILNTENVFGVNKMCRIQLDEFNRGLINFELWALKLYDSSAKIPSGLLNGNVNQYGDFDQCLETKNGLMKGKYCLPSFQISIIGNVSREFKEIFDEMHSYQPIKSRLTDPGHRVPRFSSITWGLCIPDKCSANDLQILLKANLLKYFSISDKIKIDILVDPYMCQTKIEDTFSNGTIIVSLLFCIILAITCYATITDRPDDVISSEIIKSFSLKRTLKQLFSFKRSECDIKAIHGIRFLNAILLIFAHKSMAIFYHPFINRTEMATNLGQPWSVIGRAASLYTDPFIMFSGLLTCYSIIGNIKKNKKVSTSKEYINRLFRIVPNLSALILFCTWILPVLGSGPQWPLVIQHHSDNCKKYWWRNFLFIHNYFGFEKMCLTHTHHIGIDTQLFLLGVPLIIWMETRIHSKKPVLTMFSIFALVSTIARFYVSYKMELVNFVTFGATVEKIFETADYMYILPMYRFTVYAMGVFLAVLLTEPLEFKFTRNQLLFGWLLCILSIYASFFWPMNMSHLNYKYDKFHNALFASLAPVGWCFGFAWIIYTVHHGYTSWVGDFFSWRGFVIWTRISYAVYLTQFPVFFYFIGSARAPLYFNMLGAYINWNELFCILLCSIAMTLFIDLPFQNVKFLIFPHKNKEEKKMKSSISS